MPSQQTSFKSSPLRPWLCIPRQPLSSPQRRLTLLKQLSQSRLTLRPPMQRRLLKQGKLP